MGRAKDDSKPRGRMTAYAFFIQTAREEEKRLNPGGSVVFADFSRACAGRWNNLSDEGKHPYKLMADRDKTRYEAQMKQFPGVKRGRGGGMKRKGKDPNAPKRSLSAFFCFCSDERQKVKAMNPEYGIGDVAKVLGRMWGTASPQVKERYQALSEKDKARYEREMQIYKSQGPVHHGNNHAGGGYDDEDEDESGEED